MNPHKSQRVVIVAGEESGDQHAAELVRQLKLTHPNLALSGIGGQHMLSAGVELISDLARYGVTGVTAVLRYFFIIRRAFKAIQAHLLAHKPDLLILVDYPGFNLRLAKFAKQNGIRVLYYISPQIWAWKAGRIRTIQHCVDHMAVILPFEKEIYTNAGVAASFVGHPLMHRPPSTTTNQKELGLPDNKRLIAMLPGSRTNEIEHHMPILVETIQRLMIQNDDLHFVIPVAGTLNPDTIAAYFKSLQLPITLVQGHAVEVASCCECIIVASGTASLECALLEKPMCIIYKGSWLSYFLLCCFIKIQYLGLCNILQNSMIVPELLQYDLNASELEKLTLELLNNDSLSQSMKKNLHELKQSLSNEQSDCTLSELVLRKLEC